MSDATPQTPAINTGDNVLQKHTSRVPRVGFEHLPSPGGLVAGGLLGLYALKRRDLAGLFCAGVSAGLLYQGAQQNGLLNGGWMRRLLHTNNSRFVSFDRQIIIDRPPGEVFEFWKTPENLAIYLPRVRDVEQLQQSLTRWQLKLTDGLRLQWTAELLEARPGELLVWRTRNPSDLFHEGWVQFEPLRDGESTRVTVQIYILAPGGTPGAKLLERFADSPLRFFSDDLQRLRDVLESNATDSSDDIAPTST